MRLSLQAMSSTVSFGAWGPRPGSNLEVIREAESLGYDTVWTAEASGNDAVVPLAWIGAHTSRIRLGTAIMQMTARAPTMTAMTAVTLDSLSGGRFLLGLGTSGPAVVEGWHGQPFGHPLERTAEYVSIVRRVLARSSPVVHQGDHYQIPYRGIDGLGLGEPTRLMVRPKRRTVPIYLAAMGPKNVELAYRIADGVIPAFYSPWREKEFFDGVDRGDRQVDLAPFVSIEMGDDLAACRSKVRAGLAFWIGGMGAAGVNYYNQLVTRLGFEEAAAKIQALYTSGRWAEAAAALPDQLIDELTLLGPREHVADQLDVWKASSVTTMILRGPTPEAIRTVAELVL